MSGYILCKVGVAYNGTICATYMYSSCTNHLVLTTIIMYMYIHLFMYCTSINSEVLFTLFLYISFNAKSVKMLEMFVHIFLTGLLIGHE